MPLFEVAIIEHPKRVKAGEEQDPEKIILGPLATIADDDQSAAIAVVMDHAEKLKGVNRQRMEVLIRPFG